MFLLVLARFVGNAAIILISLSACVKAIAYNEALQRGLI